MMNTNGDVILSQNPTDMLEQARNYLQRIQLAFQESTDFDDILAIRDKGELFRQYSRRQRSDHPATRASTDNHYQTMTPDEIATLPVDQLAADDSHLHLWVPNAFLFEAKDVMDAWGFTYKTNFIWVKSTPGLGNYWRNAHELLLLGVKGSCPFLDNSQLSWIEAERDGHSSKPEVIRGLIEKVSEYFCISPRICSAPHIISIL